MKFIHAHTETHTSPPGYISINESDGHISVTVRSSRAQSASVISMNRDQLAAMHREIGTYLNDTAPAAPEA